MKTPSIALALVASFAAALIIGVSAMPPASVVADAAASENPTVVQRTRDRDDRSRNRDDRRHERRQPADCHRDVRTHRINGALVTHRHVGSDCSVRVVRRSGEPAPRR